MQITYLLDITNKSYSTTLTVFFLCDVEKVNLGLPKIIIYNYIYNSSYSTILLTSSEPYIITYIIYIYIYI